MSVPSPPPSTPPLERFIEAQAIDTNSKATIALQDHAAGCVARYFFPGSSGGSRSINSVPLQSDAGPVRAAATHPLLAFLATPRLPPELEAYLAK